MLILGAVLLLGALMLSALLTALSRRLALRLGLVARPKEARYHRSVIPLGGGIAIFGTLAVFILVTAGFVRFLVVPGHFAWVAQKANVDPNDFLRRCDELAIVLVCAAALFAVGLWDDRRSLGPFVKLAVQWGVALAAAALADIRVELFIDNKIITSVLSAFWIAHDTLPEA